MINRRIIASGLSIVSALAVMGGATFAAFSSQASNNGNTFGAGSLTLQINGQSGSASTPVFAISNAAPGATSTQVLNLKNSGTTNATSTELESIDVTVDAGNAFNLGDELTLELYNDVNDDGLLDGGDTLISSGVLTNPGWANTPLGFGLNAGGDQNVLAKVTFNSGAGNIYQGMGVTFDFNFKASQ